MRSASTTGPNIRVDNGNIADSGVITGVESLRYAGAEAAAVFGPFTVAGEDGRLWLDRPTASRTGTSTASMAMRASS